MPTSIRKTLPRLLGLRTVLAAVAVVAVLGVFGVFGASARAAATPTYDLTGWSPANPNAGMVTLTWTHSKVQNLFYVRYTATGHTYSGVVTVTWNHPWGDQTVYDSQLNQDLTGIEMCVKTKGSSGYVQAASVGSWTGGASSCGVL